MSLRIVFARVSHVDSEEEASVFARIGYYDVPDDVDVPKNRTYIVDGKHYNFVDMFGEIEEPERLNLLFVESTPVDVSAAFVAMPSNPAPEGVPNCINPTTGEESRVTPSYDGSDAALAANEAARARSLAN